MILLIDTDTNGQSYSAKWFRDSKSAVEYVYTLLRQVQEAEDYLPQVHEKIAEADYYKDYSKIFNDSDTGGIRVGKIWDSVIYLHEGGRKDQIENMAKAYAGNGRFAVMANNGSSYCYLGSTNNERKAQRVADMIDGYVLVV